MFCPKCGHKNPEGAKFCESCGASFAPDAPPPAQAQAVPTPPPAPVAAPPPPAPAPAPVAYQQPVAPAPDVLYPPMSVGQYLGTIILFGIPVVGFILMLVWGFSSDVNKNKKNFALAHLILIVIGIVLTIVLTVVFGGALWALLVSLGELS